MDLILWHIILPANYHYISMYVFNAKNIYINFENITPKSEIPFYQQGKMDGGYTHGRQKKQKRCRSSSVPQTALAQCRRHATGDNSYDIVTMQKTGNSGCLGEIYFDLGPIRGKMSRNKKQAFRMFTKTKHLMCWTLVCEVCVEMKCVRGIREEMRGIVHGIKTIKAVPKFSLGTSCKLET